MGDNNILIRKQSNSIYISLFLYGLFTLIGYVGLSQTTTLHLYRYLYLVVMLSGLISTITFFLLSMKSSRAVYFLLGHFCLNLSIILFMLTLTGISIGNLSKFNSTIIILSMSIYVVSAFCYFYKFPAVKIWKRNLKYKKYNLNEGIFFPSLIYNAKKNKATYAWFTELFLLSIIFIISAIRYSKVHIDYKFILIGLLSFLVSFVILKFAVTGFLYPSIKVFLWEIKLKKKFMIQGD